jgi:hypothetical protein
MAQPFALAVRRLLWAGGKLCEDTTSSISMAESFLQQLQQSGLLQHLATVMSRAAHSIWELQSQTSSDVLAAALTDPAYDHTQDCVPSSSLQQLHLHASRLCACVNSLQSQLAAVRKRSGSERWHELLLPVAVPALELSVLTAQHVSTCLELLPARVTSPPRPLWRAQLLACDNVKQYAKWCLESCSCCAGLRQQLLQSPYHLPATCIVLLVAVYGTLLCKDAQAWWDAASSSSSSSSSSSRQDVTLQKSRWRQTAWQLACSHHDALPTSHYLLLQLAGCSSKALLWAATEDYTGAQANLARAANLYKSEVRNHLCPRIEEDFSSPGLVPETSAAFLRLAVLLHWGWHYWKESQGALQGQQAVTGRLRVLHTS